MCQFMSFDIDPGWYMMVVNVSLKATVLYLLGVIGNAYWAI